MTPPVTPPVTPIVRLQPLTRARVGSLGDPGATWLAALPDLLAELSHDWGLELGRALPGGSSSYVVRVRTRDGQEAVLKVAVPERTRASPGSPSPALAQQVATLLAADGCGYVRLLRQDLDRRALLLERLGRPLERSGLTPEEQLAALADTLLLAWQDPHGRQPGVGGEEDKAAGLAELIGDLWPKLGRPGSRKVIDRALGYAAELAVGTDPAALAVVHGDPHPGNLLQVRASSAGASTGWRFVDPDGFVADRAYDLGVAVRDWSGRLRDGNARPTLERYCALLAERTGVSAERIWRWGYVERVSTGLYVMAFGAERVGRPFLETAELLG